jgi:hypothetical protein
MDLIEEVQLKTEYNCFSAVASCLCLIQDTHVQLYKPPNKRLITNLYFFFYFLSLHVPTACCRYQVKHELSLKHIKTELFFVKI